MSDVDTNMFVSDDAFGMPVSTGTELSTRRGVELNSGGYLFVPVNIQHYSLTLR